METKVGLISLMSTRAMIVWQPLFKFRFLSVADGIDERVELDFEDGFEQSLADNIDGASQKR